MAGSHLQRTGYRHAVLGLAAISTLVAAMWTTSAFLPTLAESRFDNTVIMKHAYVVARRFALGILALNAVNCALITGATLVLDWHLDVRIPAYAEYCWVAIAWVIQLIAVILSGLSSPPDVCSLQKSVLGPTESDETFDAQVALGKTMCSNWRAVLVTSLMGIGFLTFHLTWHLIFRLRHRAVLANRPSNPINIWKTPLPRRYPVSTEDKPKTDDPAFLALDERGIKPEDSLAYDPYILIFSPVAARQAERSAAEAAKDHAVPVVNVIAPVEDLEQGRGKSEQDDSSKVPPGLESVVTSQGSSPVAN